MNKWAMRAPLPPESRPGPNKGFWQGLGCALFFDIVLLGLIALVVYMLLKYWPW